MKSTLSSPENERVRVLYLYPANRGFVRFEGVYSPERKMII